MAIQLKQLSKAYQGKQVLEQFSLSLPERGAVCFFGPSGCGKTTLLNCIAGIEKPDSGAVLGLEGKKISYIFQEDRLLPWLDANANVAAVLKGKSELARQEAAYWLELVGMGREQQKYPDELSGGMRQRVSIARALAYGGDLYLLDEPFHALDEASKAALIRLIEEHTPHALKILITHDRGEAESMAETVYDLSGPPLRILEEKQP